MKVIYEWIRSLVSYMILMTMIMNLLPDRKYEKYLRLFAGVVFLLLVISPFTELEAVTAQAVVTFGQITMQEDAERLKQEIEDADRKRLERLEAEYQRALEENLAAEMEKCYGVEEGKREVITETE